jgi:DNA-binding transcriptional ArsR family regulator
VSDDDICAGYHRGADTSRAANPSAAEKRVQRLRVYAGIRQAYGGATCDELEVALDMRHQTASARITELRKDGLIVDTGLRRATRSGRSARVYEIVTAAGVLSQRPDTLRR